ncbi:MAG: FAA hydrolase family protein [Gammaproteobacteria bacterium]|nr:MAG: FAA hydrolase family protein [Gammaproteobacteria bacterium]
MEFGLATLLRDGEYIGALEVAEAFWPLGELRDNGVALPSDDVKQLLTIWPAAFPQLQGAAAICASGKLPGTIAIPRAVARLDVPIRFPNKLLGVGGNYADHLTEMGMLPKRIEPMAIFTRPPTTTMVGPGKTVVMPRKHKQLDWEIELAVVIGAHMSHVSPGEAMAGVAGYTVGIDLSVRDLARQADVPFRDVFRAKCQDTMCPVGPVVRPAVFVPNPHELTMKLTVNGVLRQHASTGEMLYRIEEQLSIISEVVRLEPGDVVLTGTPFGSGVHHGFFLKPGDRITAEIERVGTLQVEVVHCRSVLAASYAT